jgi:glycosyltransferase involved in cell wall biosynthesis
VIAAVVPALDEAGAIGEVVRGLRAHADQVIVVDNGSRDATAAIARAAGADVVWEPRRGYGRAMLAGIARARGLGAGVIVTADADGSDDPADLPRLLAPLSSGRADLVLGVRADVEACAMTPVQRFGNWFAPLAMRLLAGARYADMPPFKAIRASALDRLQLEDTGHGFTIELLLEAHAARLRVVEIDVRCRARRAGVSKVSGTLVGSARASAKILWTILRHGRRKNPWTRAPARSES